MAYLHRRFNGELESASLLRHCDAGLGQCRSWVQQLRHSLEDYEAMLATSQGHSRESVELEGRDGIYGYLYSTRIEVNVMPLMSVTPLRL